MAKSRSVNTGHGPPYVYLSLLLKKTNTCMFSTFPPLYYQWLKIFIWSKREQNTYSLIRDQYDCFVIQERSLQNYLSHLFSPFLTCPHKNCWQTSVFANCLGSIDSLPCDIWGGFIIRVLVLGGLFIFFKAAWCKQIIFGEI